MKTHEVTIEWCVSASGVQTVEVQAESMEAAVAAVKDQPMEFFDGKQAKKEIGRGHFELTVGAGD